MYILNLAFIYIKLKNNGRHYDIAKEEENDIHFQKYIQRIVTYERPFILYDHF